MQRPRVVWTQIDTLILSIKGEMLSALAEELNELKAAAQAAEDDVASPWTIDGQTLFVKPHGFARQWKWILTCPALNLTLGGGNKNHLVGRARLGSAFLAEHDIGDVLAMLYDLLVQLLGNTFVLQVSELHLCADIAGWDLKLSQLKALICRGHTRSGHLPEDSGELDAEGNVIFHEFGRTCTGLEFSRKGPHSVILYDKLRELATSGKLYLKDLWAANGWDGQSRVIRVEVRYKREALNSFDINDPYAMLDELASLWAYSTQEWLRHTVPTRDTNRGRWETSPLWAVVQSATFAGDAHPAIRTKKHEGNLTRLCQQLSGLASSAAAYLPELPAGDEEANFLSWFLAWQEGYLEEKGITFAEIRAGKQLRRGVVRAA